MTTTLIKSTIDALSVGNPSKWGALSLFPLFRHDNPDAGIIAASQGLQAGSLIISELPDGTVPSLIVRNHTGSRVLLLAGEVVFGGFQDRMVTSSVLLGSGKSEISVACVEAGRWSGSTIFETHTGLSPHQLRRQAIYANTDRDIDQGEVWHEVADRLATVGTSHPTGSLRAAMAPREDQELLDDIVPTTVPQQCGVAISKGKQVLGVELFTSRQVLDSYWDAILAAYDSDNVGSSKAEPGMAEVLKFIQDTIDGLLPIDNTGLGVQHRMSDQRVAANALTDIDTLIQLSVLAAA